MRVNRDVVPHAGSSGNGETGLGPDFDDRRFRERFRQSDFSSELFISPAHGAWRKGRFLLNRDDRPEARTDISGVRLQAADPRHEDLSLERQVQTDVVNLVASVRKLRQMDGLERVVLSKAPLKLKQPVRGQGTRVKFGLDCDPDGKLDDDRRAAAACHGSIRNSIRRSGLVIEQPKTRFDPATGLAGLEEWGSQLVLRRRRNYWPWLLLLPLLLLLKTCDPNESFFGFDLEHRSLIVVVDKSGSMESIFPLVREEAKDTLAAMKQAGWFGTRYANVITYDGQTQSALGKLEELNEETEKRLNDFLDNLQAGGGTTLRPALEQAAREVAAHGKPTTLVILTDGQGDATINLALADMGPLLEAFQGVEIVGHTMTPRLLTPEGRASPAPINADENSLESLAREMNGTFGSNRDTEE